MHITGLIAGAAVIIVWTLFNQWVFHAQFRRAPQKGGRAIVRYGLPVKTGHALVTMSLLGLVIAAARSCDSRLVIMCIGTMAFVILCFLFELYTKRIEFDDREFVIYFAWCKPKHVPWTDVVALKSESIGWFVHTRSHGKITFLTLLSGLQDLRDAAAKHTNLRDAAAEHTKNGVPPIWPV